MITIYIQELCYYFDYDCNNNDNDNNNDDNDNNANDSRTGWHVIGPVWIYKLQVIEKKS